MKKTVIFKTAFAAIMVILLALPLATCGVETLEGGGDDDNEYTDVLYDAVRVGNDYRVKSVTLLLNGMVPKPRSQRAMERALSLEGARMSHDYFEAVFYSSASSIARAAWEIGQPAGISGVDRGVGDYRGVDATAITATIKASIVFVGRKTGKTLLGVGYLTHINNLDITGTLGTPNRTIDGNTDSVTFTVSSLATWLGLVGVGSPITHHIPNEDRKDLDTPLPTSIGTFVTAYGDTVGATIAARYQAANEGFTRGEIMRPRGTGAEFPLYYLPSVKDPALAAEFYVNALYKIGGLTAATIPTSTSFPTTGLAPAVRIWGARDGTASYPTGTGTLTETAGDSGASPPVPALKGGLQFIKRTPAFMVSGVNYEINDTFHDKVTKIDDTSTAALALMPAADAAFPVAGLPVRFVMYPIATTKQSGGIFAVTFQVPVYALVPDRATNSGALAPEKWWVRPDYSQYQYLLDNGTDSGGAVLLGTDVEGGGGDWIQINTKGIGFDNE